MTYIMLSFLAVERVVLRPFPRNTRAVCQRTARLTCSAADPVLQQPSLSSANLETLFRAIHRSPAKPGVYRFHDASGVVLYVGKARRLNERLRHYIQKDDTSPTGVIPSVSLPTRTRAMVEQARMVDYVITESEAAALALEAAMVNELRPRFNVLLKDDRRHPYALITFSEQYPRIVLSRTRKRRHSLDRLYGPFVDEGRLRHVLNVIHTLFPLRQRARRLFTDRPCINYDLGRCPGVCQELITPEEYAATVAKVDKLLSGRVTEVVDSLRAEMKVLSDAMLYERAAEVRDRIATLERTFYSLGESLYAQYSSASSIVDSDPFASRDVFAVARVGSIGKVVLFQVRGGKVISKLVFSVAADNHQGDRAELLATVMSSHYSQVMHAMEVPEEVVLCEKSADMDMLRAVLTEKRGKAVKVRLAGTKTRAISKMAQQNADMEVQLEAQRVEDFARDLVTLREMISPYYNNLIGEVADVQQLSFGEGEKDILNLYRIECYDISHTSGANAVGSMSVFVDGVAVPSEYRRYNLSDFSSSSGHPDDFESLRETLRRRFKDLMSSVSTEGLPDLIVIDGGKGQLGASAEILRELGIRKEVGLLSIAKREECIFVEGVENGINYDRETGRYTMNDGVRLVCRVRDEAHRTAIGAHRKRRGKQTLRSGLDSVPGLGLVKREALLEYFHGSAEAVSQAPVAELKKAAGIGPALAQRIVNHFRDDRGENV